MGDFSGTIPSFTVERAKASELQTLADALRALTGPWTAYTPTVANLTTTGGTLVGRYRRVGAKLDVLFSFTLGASSAVGAVPTFDLPPGMTLHSSYLASALVGQAYLLDAGTTIRHGFVEVADSNTLRIGYYSAAHTPAPITATAPWTWATGDVMWCVVHDLELA